MINEKFLSDHDKRMFEKAEKPGGITTMGCLFCKDQISVSADYVKNYEAINWKKDGCQHASCPFFNTRACLELMDEDVREDSTNCPFKE